MLWKIIGILMPLNFTILEAYMKNSKERRKEMLKGEGHIGECE